MSRVVRDWREERADDFPVAPHRYVWSGTDDTFLHAKTHKEFKAGCPYKEGEVVFVEHGGKPVRAKIIGVWRERDYYGDPRVVYRVQLETAKGIFSKLWTTTWPGFIQRGYQLAGLAPDIPASN